MLVKVLVHDQVAHCFGVWVMRCVMVWTQGMRESGKNVQGEALPASERACPLSKHGTLTPAEQTFSCGL